MIRQKGSTNLQRPEFLLLSRNAKRPSGSHKIRSSISLASKSLNIFSFERKLIWTDPPDNPFQVQKKTVLRFAKPNITYLEEKPRPQKIQSINNAQSKLSILHPYVIDDLAPTQKFQPISHDSARFRFGEMINILQSNKDPEMIFYYSTPSAIYDKYQIVLLIAPSANEFSSTIENSSIPKVISRNAFINFKLGGYDNKSHIFAWHNLNFHPPEITERLVSFTNKIFQGEKNNLMSELRCVISYILTWIHWFPADFAYDPSIAESLILLLDQICIHFPPLAIEAFYAKAFLITLKEAIQTPEAFSIPMSDYVIHETPIRGAIFEFKIPPSILVHHIMYDELSDFRKLQVSEFMHGNWMKSEIRKQLAPNCVSLIDNFNQRTTFIRLTILSKASNKERACAIEYWINVMIAAEELRDFQLIFEIDGALCHPNVKQICDSWKLVSKNLIASKNRLSELTNPIPSKKIDLKNKEKENPRITLPYLGNALDNLNTWIENSKKQEMVPDGSIGINMYIQQKYLEEIDFIFNEWGADINFQLDPHLLDEVHQMIFLKNKSV